METPSSRQTFALLAPPIAWVVHELASVIVAGTLCSSHAGSVRAINGAIAVFALVVSVGALATGVRTWSNVDHDTTVGDSEARTRPQFMTVSAIFFGIVFTLALCWGSLALVLVRTACVGGRE